MDYRVYCTIYAVLTVAWVIQLFKIEWVDRTAPVIGGAAMLTGLIQYLEWLWS